MQLQLITSSNASILQQRISYYWLLDLTGMGGREGGRERGREGERERGREREEVEGGG